MATNNRLEIFQISGNPFNVEVVPSPVRRDWMDEFPARHPYRCLPLVIANTHGWDILCPMSLEIDWNGTSRAEDLVIRAFEPLPEGLELEQFARSHFTGGIVTFVTDLMFRTPPGWNLLVTGPVNRPKSGVQALTGVVETDWVPNQFSINWAMTCPGKVTFSKGEPICTLYPIPRGYLSDWDVAIHDMADDPDLSAEYRSFTKSREGFAERYEAGDPATQKEPWQRHYFVGVHPDGRVVEGHVNKVRLADPVDARGTSPILARPEGAV